MAKLLTDKNKVAFCTAALGVIINCDSNTQSFFQAHEEDVVSFDLHPERRIAATGQMAMKGKSKFIDIFVWDIETKKILNQINGFHLRAVRLLKFTQDGKYLLSIGEDDDNSMAVYDWQSNRLIASAKVDKTNVLGIDSNSPSEFMTVGSRHVKVWKLSGCQLKGSQISWPQSAKQEPVICCAGLDGKGFAIGTAKGNLMLVRGSIEKPQEVHKGKIYVM